MKKRIIVLLMLLTMGVMVYGQEQSGEKQEAPPALEEAYMGIALFVGSWGSWVDGFKEAYGKSGGLTWGGELGFNLTNNLYAVLKYTYFYQTHEVSELNFTQNIFNCGVRYSFIGAGLTYTTLKIMSTSSGIGFFVELLLPIDKHLFAGVKADFVSINSAKAGGICYYAGYSF